MTVQNENLPEFFILQKPVRYFTKDFSCFLNPVTLTIAESFPACLEDEGLLAYVHSGYGRILINGTTYELKPGTFCNLHSYHVFRIIPDMEQEMKVSFLVYDYLLSSYTDLMTDSANLPALFKITLSPVTYPPQTHQEEIVQLLDDLAEENQHPDRFSLFIRSALFFRLNMLFAHVLQHHPQCCTSVPDTLAHRLIVYLTSYAHEDPSLKQLSTLFETPTGQIAKTLRINTGLNFQQFLTRAKINYAAPALLYKHISLYSIAMSSGFSSESTFYRAFRTWRGCTPQEYRDQCAAIKFQAPQKLLYDKHLKILLYILNHYKEELSLKSMSEELFISEKNIIETLQEYFHVSYHELVTTLRLRYAQALLIVTDLPLEDICMYAGMQSVHTFIRIFKKKHRMTPTEYRKMYKEKLYD